MVVGIGQVRIWQPFVIKLDQKKTIVDEVRRNLFLMKEEKCC